MFSYLQYLKFLHNNRSIDNNICHCSPKVYLNFFYGYDPLEWITKMEHYFSLQGITGDMMKLMVGVLYLDK